MGLLVAWGDDANFVAQRRRLPPALQPAAAAVPEPAARSSLSILNTPIARDPRRGLLRGHVEHRAVRRARRAVLRLRRVQRRGPPRLRRAVPVLAVLLHHRDLGVALGQGVRRRAVQHPHPRSRSKARRRGARRARARSRCSSSTSTVDFDITWGESADTTLPPIAVLPLLDGRARASARTGARCCRRRRSLLVSLRKLDRRTTALVLHPVGALRVSQRAVPLDLTIDKVGNQKPSDAKRLRARRSPAAGSARRRRRTSSSRRRSSSDLDDADEAVAAGLRAASTAALELSAGRQPARVRRDGQARRALRADHHRHATSSASARRFVVFTGALLRASS